VSCLKLSVAVALASLGFAGCGGTADSGSTAARTVTVKQPQPDTTIADDNGDAGDSGVRHADGRDAERQGRLRELVGRC
jgi:hypothetical protein